MATDGGPLLSILINPRRRDADAFVEAAVEVSDYRLGSVSGEVAGGIASV